MGKNKIKMAQEAPIESGNTNDSNIVESKKKRTRARKWCLTINNPTLTEKEEFIEWVKDKEGKYIVGTEKGESGTLHLQCFIEFKNAIEFSVVKSFNKRAHIEKARGNIEENMKYCSKDGIYDTNMKLPEKLNLITKLKPWQSEIEEMIKGVPDGKVHWYWESEGQIGKTSISKYLSHHYGAIPLMGKGNDVLNIAFNNDSKIYIFPLTRRDIKFVCWKSIEKIVDGYYMSGKYEGGVVNRNTPWLLVFANFEPEEDIMSKGRVVIHPL